MPQHAQAIAMALSAPPAAPVERKRRISKRLAEVVRLLVTGTCTTQRAAAERAGLSEQHVSEALRKPEIQVFIAREARQTLANGTMRASARLLELLQADSEHVSLDATKHVLGIAGIKPAADAQVSVNIELKAGYVIDLRDDERVAAMTIDGVVSD